MQQAISLAITLLLIFLPACSPNNASNPSLLETSTRESSHAQCFIEQTTEEELLHILGLVNATQGHTTNTQRVGFRSPADLFTLDFYNFFLEVLQTEKEMKAQYINEDDWKYHIPLQTLTDSLSQYFETYQFDPSILPLQSFYNREEQEFILPASITSEGKSLFNKLEIENVEIIDPSTVQIQAIEYYHKNGLRTKTISSTHTLLLKIESNGYKFLSNTIAYPTDFRNAPLQAKEKIKAIILQKSKENGTRATTRAGFLIAEDQANHFDIVSNMKDIVKIASRLLECEMRHISELPVVQESETPNLTEDVWVSYDIDSTYDWVRIVYEPFQPVSGQNAPSHKDIFYMLTLKVIKT